MKDFDTNRKSCRKMLARHNMRRNCKPSGGWGGGGGVSRSSSATTVSSELPPPLSLTTDPESACYALMRWEVRDEREG